MSCVLACAVAYLPVKLAAIRNSSKWQVHGLVRPLPLPLQCSVQEASGNPAQQFR